MLDSDCRLKVMLPEDREKHTTCFFCNSSLSVKYFVRIGVADVPCCNLCALKQIGVSKYDSVH